MVTGCRKHKRTDVTGEPYSEKRLTPRNLSSDTMIGYVILVLCGLQLVALPNASAQTCVGLWKKEHCRIDRHMGLNKGFIYDDREHFNDNDVEYLNKLVCKCRLAAIGKTCSWFAIEKYGLCFCNPGPLADYLKIYPVDTQDHCIGPFSTASNKTINGVPCVGGEYRAFFYSVILGPARDVIRCTHKVDVIFLVDSTGSISAEGVIEVQKYIRQGVGRFDFKPGHTRIALLQYDVTVSVVFSLQDSTEMSKSDVDKRIGNLKYTGASTRTDLALDAVANIIKTQSREGVSIYLIVVTDGETWDPTGTLLPTAVSKLTSASRSLKIVVVAIGKEINEANLKLMTKAEGSRIIRKTSTKELTDTSVASLDEIIKTVCV